MSKAKLPSGSLDTIRAAQDVGTETLDIPEWGVSVTVKGLTMAEVRSLGDDPVESEVRALTLGMVEPTVSEDEARSILDTKAFSPTQTVLMKVLELSGMGATFRS